MVGSGDGTHGNDSSAAFCHSERRKMARELVGPGGTMTKLTVNDCLEWMILEGCSMPRKHTETATGGRGRIVINHSFLNVMILCGMSRKLTWISHHEGLSHHQFCGTIPQNLYSHGTCLTWHSSNVACSFEPFLHPRNWCWQGRGAPLVFGHSSLLDSSRICFIWRAHAQSSFRVQTEQRKPIDDACVRPSEPTI